MKDNVINEKNVKIPLYVTAYETISQWLKEGKYKAGDKLPGENILAEQLAVSIGFQPATQKHQQVLKLRPSSVVAVIDITYYCGDTPAGFAMVYMPHEVLDNSDVDLENPDTVYQYYTGLLSEGGLYSDAKIRLGQARERLANILNMQEGDPILILEEVLYSEYDTPVLSQKLFFGSEQHELSIRRKNDRNIIKKSE